MKPVITHLNSRILTIPLLLSACAPATTETSHTATTTADTTPAVIAATNVPTSFTDSPAEMA